jgi:hypothetical protein
MIIIETVKLIAEVITSIAAASIVVIHLVQLMCKLCTSMKIFFKTTFKMFFNGFTTLDGKKVRFCKGLKKHRERQKNILEAVLPNHEMENILVLDKKALLDIISNSKAFYPIRQRKN